MDETIRRTFLRGSVAAAALAAVPTIDAADVEIAVGTGATALERSSVPPRARYFRPDS
jgi:hypothetical protein